MKFRRMPLWNDSRVPVGGKRTTRREEASISKHETFNIGIQSLLLR